MASLLYSFKLICSVLGTVDKCGNHNFCVVLYGDASGSEMTRFTINQSFPSSCVSSCYRKACRQRWTSSYPHTWSVTSYWGLWWSFAGISFSFSQGNSRRVYVCVFCECVCLWNSGWLTALHTVTHRFFSHCTAVVPSIARPSDPSHTHMPHITTGVFTVRCECLYGIRRWWSYRGRNNPLLGKSA